MYDGQNHGFANWSHSVPRQAGYGGLQDGHSRHGLQSAQSYHITDTHMPGQNSSMMLTGQSPNTSTPMMMALAPPSDGMAYYIPQPVAQAGMVPLMPVSMPVGSKPAYVTYPRPLSVSVAGPSQGLPPAGNPMIIQSGHAGRFAPAGPQMPHQAAATNTMQSQRSPPGYGQPFFMPSQPLQMPPQFPSTAPHQTASHASPLVQTPAPTQETKQPRRVQRGLEENVKRTIYVSYVDVLVSEEQLATFFGQCGPVVDCRICADPNSAMRFAFLEFADISSAQKALSMTGTLLGGWPLRVQPSKTAIVPVSKDLMPRSQDELLRCSRTVYVASIDNRVEKADLSAFFEGLCGPVAKLRLLGDATHHTRIAFVEFVNADGALAALNCSGALLGSMPVRVSPSKTPIRSDTRSHRGSSGRKDRQRRSEHGLHREGRNAATSDNVPQADSAQDVDVLVHNASNVSGDALTSAAALVAVSSVVTGPHQSSSCMVQDDDGSRSESARADATSARCSSTDSIVEAMTSNTIS